MSGYGFRQLETVKVLKVETTRRGVRVTGEIVISNHPRKLPHSILAPHRVFTHRRSTLLIST